MKIETYFKIRFYNLNVSPKHFCGHSYNFSTKLLRITMIRLTKIYSNSRVIPVGDFGEGSVYRCGYKNYLVRYNNIVTISTIAQGTSIDTSLCCLPLGLLGFHGGLHTHRDHELLYKLYLSNWKTISVGVILSLCDKTASPRNTRREDEVVAYSLAWSILLVSQHRGKYLKNICTNTKIANEIWYHGSYMNIARYCMLHEIVAQIVLIKIWERINCNQYYSQYLLIHFAINKMNYFLIYYNENTKKYTYCKTQRF